MLTKLVKGQTTQVSLAHFLFCGFSENNNERLLGFQENLVRGRIWFLTSVVTGSVRKKIESRVWERGVGETLACGSGASAIAVAARLLDYANSEVEIMLAGGSLTVSRDSVGDVLLSGAVEEVFVGEWPEEGS